MTRAACNLPAMSAREAVLGLYPGPVLAQPRPRSPHLYLHPRLNPPLRASPRPPRSSPRIAPPAAAAVTSTAPSPLPPSPSPPPPSPSPPPLSPPLPSSSPPPPQLLPHRLRPNRYVPLAVASNNRRSAAHRRRHCRPRRLRPHPRLRHRLHSATASTLTTAAAASAASAACLPRQRPPHRLNFGRGGLHRCAQRSPQTPSAGRQPAPPQLTPM